MARTVPSDLKKNSEKSNRVEEIFANQEWILLREKIIQSLRAGGKQYFEQIEDEFIYDFFTYTKPQERGDLYNIVFYEDAYLYLDSLNELVKKRKSIGGTWNVIQETGYQINKFLSLKLKNNETWVYVGKKKVGICKFLILNIPLKDIPKYDHIESIDHLIKVTKVSEVEHTHNKSNLITPEQEFWGHCSNFQAWAEHDYDVRLIDTRLAFPILKYLAIQGDAKAEIVYKEAIADRIKRGNKTSWIPLISVSHLSMFTFEELEIVAEDVLDSEAGQKKHDTILLFIKQSQEIILKEEEKKRRKAERIRIKTLRQKALKELQEKADRINKTAQSHILTWLYFDKNNEIPPTLYLRQYHNKKWLIKMLFRYNVRQIAKRCQVSSNTIYYWIKKLEISRRKINHQKIVYANMYKNKVYPPIDINYKKKKKNAET